MENLAKDVSFIKKQNEEILNFLNDNFPFVKLTPKAKKERIEILNGYMGLIFDVEGYRRRINDLLNHPKYSSLSDKDQKTITLLKFAIDSNYLEEVLDNKDKASSDLAFLPLFFGDISNIEYTIKSL